MIIQYVVVLWTSELYVYRKRHHAHESWHEYVQLKKSSKLCILKATYNKIKTEIELFPIHITWFGTKYNKYIQQ